MSVEIGKKGHTTIMVDLVGDAKSYKMNRGDYHRLLHDITEAQAMEEYIQDFEANNLMNH